MVDHAHWTALNRHSNCPNLSLEFVIFMIDVMVKLSFFTIFLNFIDSNHLRFVRYFGLGPLKSHKFFTSKGPFVGSDWSRKTQVFHFSPSSEVDQKVERISNPADSWPAWKSGCGKWDPSFFEGVSNLWPLGGGFNFLLKDFHPDLWGNDLRFVKGDFLRMLPR